MVEGGFLFAGFSETMRYLNEDFVPIQMDDAFIYQKPFSTQPSTQGISGPFKQIRLPRLERFPRKTDPKNEPHPSEQNPKR